MDYMIRKVLDALCNSTCGFITPNQDGLYEENIIGLFAAFGTLESEGVIRRRDCEGVAYEFCR